MPYIKLHFSLHVHQASFRHLTFGLLYMHSRLVVQWFRLTFDCSKDYEEQSKHLRLSICILLQSPLIHDELHDRWSSWRIIRISQSLGLNSLDFQNFLSVYYFIRRFESNQISSCWHFKDELWDVTLHLVPKPKSSLW